MNRSRSAERLHIQPIQCRRTPSVALEVLVLLTNVAVVVAVAVVVEVAAVVVPVIVPVAVAAAGAVVAVVVVVVVVVVVEVVERFSLHDPWRSGCSH